VTEQDILNRYFDMAKWWGSDPMVLLSRDLDFLGLLEQQCSRIKTHQSDV
jgi:hypothetical protein